MVKRYIKIQKERYYLYGAFDTWNEALKVAKKHKRKNNCCYFIIECEQKSFMGIPFTKAYLYLNKCIKLW